MSDAEEKTKGFKVTDRRKFTPEGELRKEVAEQREEKPVSEPGRPAGSGPGAAADRGKSRAVEPGPGSGSGWNRRGGGAAAAPAQGKKAPSASAAGQEMGPPPEVDFLGLVEMLATNSYVYLGEVPDPVTGQRVENLHGVQEIIAILSMLQGKTKGNLTEEESKILDNLLFDLRMRFMAKAKLIKL